MNITKTSLRDEVRTLAEQAFEKRLVSGYGDGQYSNEYQLVINGKTRHFPLEHAHGILSNILNTASDDWRLA